MISNDIDLAVRLLKKGDVFVNERVSKCQGCIHIYHGDSNYFYPVKWREYTRNYSLIDYSIVFPSNIKKLLKYKMRKY